MKKIVFVTATQKRTLDELYTTIFYKGISNMCTEVNDFELDPILNNTESLSKVYNAKLLKHSNSIIVFTHDDFIIEDSLIFDKLDQAIDLYDVVGLAGTVGPITMQRPALWHLMGPKDSLRGCVGHFAKQGPQRWMTNFGPSPSRALMVDGVFLAVNVEKLLNNNVMFDESNPARFHYYDLDISLQANKSKLKVGVFPIWGTHKSHGLEKPTPEWEQGQEWFIKKWSK